MYFKEDRSIFNFWIFLTDVEINVEVDTCPRTLPSRQNKKLRILPLWSVLCKDVCKTKPSWFCEPFYSRRVLYLTEAFAYFIPIIFDYWALSCSPIFKSGSKISMRNGCPRWVTGIALFIYQRQFNMYPCTYWLKCIFFCRKLQWSSRCSLFHTSVSFVLYDPGHMIGAAYPYV